jgi:branched-chain amino acid transport system substrate-binding protein
MKMKVKFWKLMISIALVSLLITACGGQAATQAPAPTQAPAVQPAATDAPAQPTATEAPTEAPPIKIGISLSLSGDFSADGMGFQQGYQLWADTVNKNGGLLGRQVQLDIVSDASSPDQVQTNYEKLITVDKVDLVFGPYSSLLTKPASDVANKYGYAMVEGAGGAPSVFNRGLKNVFDVSVPVLYWLDSFAEYLLALPPDQRPTSIAYATEDDPFTQPQIDRMKATMEAAGIKTAYYQVYPSETTDYNPIADKIIASKADVVVAGVFLPDLAAFVQRFRQQHYNPKALIATSGPDLGQDFLTAMGGADVAEGILNPNGWFAALDNPSNKQMVQDYIAQYGGTPDQINGDVAEGYAVGQVMQQVIEKIQSIDNAKIIEELHSGDTFDSVQGPVQFDDVGQNVAIKAYLIQWQNGKFVPIYPAVTGGTPEYPKPNWP